MAHAVDYQHDIFISYAHDDNHAPGGAPGWVDQFQEWLESWLIRRRGMSKLALWRDSRRMSGNTLFDDAISDAVSRSALFFALVSRNYLQSDYCRDELNEFYQHNGGAAAGLRVGDQCRIFTILLNNIPHEQYQQWSPALQGTTGFAFHDAGSDEKLGDFISSNDDRFEKRLRPLVDAVEEILTPMAAPAPTAALELIAPQANAIYMADVAEPLKPFRTRLIAEMEGRKESVLPCAPPPWEHDAHADEVRRLTGMARFSIHLFDQWEGRSAIDRPDSSYPREQFSIAKESPATPLVWVPPELEIERIENMDQRQFLMTCADGDRTAGHYEFVRAPQSAFINFVLEKLAQPVTIGPSALDEQSFLVDTHQKDQRYAFKLADYLAEVGVEVDFNHESGDPLVSLGKFEQAIRQVKNLIIIFGKVAPNWLHARIKLALKAIFEQFEGDQACLLENIWVYKVPSSQEEVVLPRLPPIIKINILDNSHAPSIDPAVAGQLLGAAALPGGAA